MYRACVCQMTSRRVHRSGLSGHTLLELAIAVALGLVVTAGAISLYGSQRAAFARASDAAHIHEAGMTALMLMGLQLQMAGFIPADMQQANLSAALFGCSGGRPTGADDNLACETLTSRSDGIAIRYVGDNVSTWPTGTGQSTDCLGQGVAKLAVDAPGVVLVNRFYAKPSTSTGEPELYCEGSGNTSSSQPLVEGVERIRLRYWLANSTSALEASAIAPAQWKRVVAVDLCVLVRGAPAARPRVYVDCDGVSAQGADTRARQAFWRHVALRNAGEGGT